MEPPSGPPRGGLVPWKDLLLAVSLLTLWNPPTTAQVTVESVPPSAVEGKDVCLQVHNLPGGTARLDWYKGANVEANCHIVSYVVDKQETILGPAHSGRETVYPNGSLLFQNITLKDTGYYTLQFIKRNYEVAQLTRQLRIFKPLAQPTLHASNTTVTEDKDSVVLTCSSNYIGVSIHWFFNGQSLKLTERMTLSQDNSTLTIRPVKKEDAGNYQCEVSNLAISRKSDPMEETTQASLWGPSLSLQSGSWSDWHYSSLLECLLPHTVFSEFHRIFKTDHLKIIQIHPQNRERILLQLIPRLVETLN